MIRLRSGNCFSGRKVWSLRVCWPPLALVPLPRLEPGWGILQTVCSSDSDVSSHILVQLTHCFCVVIHTSLCSAHCRAALWGAHHLSCRAWGNWVCPAGCNIISHNPSKAPCLKQRADEIMRRLNCSVLLAYHPLIWDSWWEDIVKITYNQNRVGRHSSAHHLFWQIYILFEKHDGGIVFCGRTSCTSEADKQNGLSKVTEEIFDMREEKLCFILTVYANIPTYHLCDHRRQKQRENGVIYHTGHVMGHIFITSYILYKHSRRVRKVSLWKYVSKEVRKRARGRDEKCRKKGLHWV